MQRFLLVGLLAATGTLCAAAPKKPSVHQQIAGYAAAIGTNLLAQDLKDEHGLLLLRFAGTLQPENDTVLLTTGMIERGKNPEPIKTTVTEAKLYAVIASQAKSLRLKEWPKNTKAGQLALLYYRMAERFQPPSEETMLGLMKLRIPGVEGDLEQALAQTSDLKDVFGNPEKPEPRPKHDLAEVDRSIAKYAAIWATNRLAADPNDGKGLLLLQLAGSLTPESSTVLLTLARLEREMTPDVLDSDETEEKLLDVIISRAGKLVASESEKYKNAGQLSLLYFKVAERFRPDEKKVILGLMKLKVKGIEGELDDLLATGPSVAAREPLAKPEPPVTTRPVIGKARTLAWLRMKLLPIKAGSFMMGSPTEEGGRARDEMQHEVTLRQAFWLGKHEVTREQYMRVVDSSRVKATNLPVTGVSWPMAAEFCVKLTAHERRAHRLPKGYEYRLPTEAEWEYSCRAGTKTAYSFGDDPEKLGDYAWHLENSGNRAQEVGRKKPNAWGLFDMHGNVYELCHGRYFNYPDGAATVSDRVSRGGSRGSDAKLCRAASRRRIGAGRAWGDVGFRVALAPALAAAEKPAERDEPDPPARSSRPRSKSEPPRKWLEFARKRDKLPAEEQLLLIAEELQRLHGGTEIKMRPPTIEEGKIVGLSFQRNRSLKRIEPLYGLPLRALSFQECSSLESLDGLQGMQLTRLSLHGCKTLRSLKPLRGMKLTSIGLQSCTLLESLDGLEGMPLTQLSLHWCQSLRSLKPLRGMKLTSIVLTVCSSLESLEGLEGMPLTQLKLQGSKPLRSLRPLRGMKLTSLVLLACSSLESLDGLEGMPLTQLNLHGCKSVRSLKPLTGMPLVDFTFTGVSGLRKTGYRVLEKIPTLEKVATGDQNRDERILAATKKLREKLAK